MRRRIDRDTLELSHHLAAQRVDFVKRLDLVAEELDPDCAVFLVGWKDFDGVAAHTEGSAMEVVIVALVLDIDQFAQDTVALGALTLFEKDHQLEIDLGLAEAVDTRDGGDYKDVVSLKQGLGRGMAQLVDFVVDARVLLDIRVGGRNVGLGLIVVVVGDEIADRVVRKQALELVVELGGQRLVRRHHECRAVGTRDHVGHRKGLARAGDAKQDLMPHAFQHVARKGLDRRRLIALGLVSGDELEGPFPAACA